MSEKSMAEHNRRFARSDIHLLYSYGQHFPLSLCSFTHVNIYTTTWRKAGRRAAHQKFDLLNVLLAMFVQALVTRQEPLGANDQTSLVWFI